MRIETRQFRHASILALVEAVLDGTFEDRDLKAIARDLGFSFDHLNRMCSDVTGETMGKLVRRVRLERGASALRRGFPVARAALEAGYSTPEAFAKAFSSAYGVKPRDFNGPINLPAASGVHWGSKGLVRPNVTGADRFGLSFCVLEPLNLMVRVHIGDYIHIPAAWDDLEVPRDDRTWVTLFESDGMRQTNRNSMRAYLAYILDSGQDLAGFEPMTVPGGAYVVSGPLTREEHRDAWWFMNATWVPKGRRMGGLPGFDVYEGYPAPWADLRARVHLRLTPV